MARSTFDEIKIFDDTKDNMDIIRALSSAECQEKAFYIVDIGNVIKKHQEWIAKLPKVTPYFAIKANSDPTVIKVLASLNACFDCASEQEIKQVMQYGVQGERIIFAHPTKYASHIRYARKMNVKKMTVDNESELHKIKDIFPEAKVIIRIRCDAKKTLISLGSKFGSEPNEETVRLIQLAKDLDLNLHGFSFHAGSPCEEPEAYARGIALCKQLVTVSKAIGYDKVQLIDIGGGFPGETGTDFDEIVSVINEAIEDLDPSIKVISEPGRYYVDTSFTLASCVHSKKIVPKNGAMMRMYYTTCGVYHSFLDNLLSKRSDRMPELLSEPASKETFPSNVWGPTADSGDIVLKNVMLPELHIGDWLIWKDMGAYTIALACPFNGYPIPDVIPIIKKSQWKNFKKQIDSM